MTLERVLKSTLKRNHDFYAPWHALHQSFALGWFYATCVKNYSLILIRWLVATPFPLEHISEVFTGVQVWRLGWLWQVFDLVVLHPHIDWSDCVVSSIVLLENPILRIGEYCQSRRKHVFFQDNLLLGFTCPSQTNNCSIPALLKHTRPSPSCTKFHSGCEMLWLIGLFRSPSNH